MSKPIITKLVFREYERIDHVVANGYTDKLLAKREDYYWGKKGYETACDKFVQAVANCTSYNYEIEIKACNINRLDGHIDDYTGETLASYSKSPNGSEMRSYASEDFKNHILVDHSGKHVPSLAIFERK